MEPQKAPPSRRRLTGAYTFTLSAFAGAAAETMSPNRPDPVTEALIYGALWGGSALPWILCVSPRYTMAERGTYTMAGAAGIIAGRGLVQMIRQYL